MINDTGATKRQLEGEKNLYDGMHETSCAGYCHQSATQSPSHDGRVVQGLANVHIIVIAHCCEDNQLHTSKEVFSKELHLATCKGGGLLS
jgi:hypothetical protein